MGTGQDILKLAGEALYGERWQSPLSRDLGVTDRTIRNWLSNRHERPADLYGRLHSLLQERSEIIKQIVQSIVHENSGVIE